MISLERLDKTWVRIYDPNIRDQDTRDQIRDPFSLTHLHVWLEYQQNEEK